MPVKVSDDGFVKMWGQCAGSPSAVARALETTESAVYQRRRTLAKRGIVLTTHKDSNNRRGTNGYGHADWSEAPAYKPRINLTLKDGYCVVFSDAHFWPHKYTKGKPSLAYEGLLLILKELKPKIVISNGDAFDGASISRHDPIGWQQSPTVVEELAAAKHAMWEIEKASGKARRIFTVGNHDSRFDRRLASEVGEFKDVEGFHLQDHLKQWDFCYGALVNEDTDPFFVIHAIRGGMHAPHNNVIAAGCSVYTGHLHSQKIMPYSTLLRDNEGVDSGTLADKDGPQFEYISARPTNWREGFAVQRVDKDGYRYPAELAQVRYYKKERRLVFRGEVICARKR